MERLLRTIHETLAASISSGRSDGSTWAETSDAAITRRRSSLDADVLDGRAVRHQVSASLGIQSALGPLYVKSQGICRCAQQESGFVAHDGERENGCATEITDRQASKRRLASRARSALGCPDARQGARDIRLQSGPGR